MLGAHPYEPAPVMRYASGEVPMVGDVVSIRESAVPNAYCDSATVSEASRPFVYFGEARDRAVISQCTLILRADTPEEAKDGDLHLSHPERLTEAAAVIRSAFTWDNTREGFDFWSIVYGRLRELAQKAQAAK